MKIPPPFNWFYDAWMEFSRVLGLGMSKVVLTVLWIVGFGIYGIILKIVNLFIRKAEAPGTHWIAVQEQSDLHRQF